MQNCFYWIVLWGGLILLNSCVAPETAPHIEGKYERARQLEDYHTAIVYLHELRDLGGETHSVYRRLATCYFKTQNYNSAILAADVILDEANELEKKDLLLIKAKSYTEAVEYTNAIGAYDALTKIDPERALEYTYQTGILYNAHGDLGNSIIRLQQIIDNPLAKLVEKEIKSPSDQIELVTYYQAALNFMGVVQMRAGDLAQAQKTYQVLLQEPKVFQLAIQNYQQLIQAIEIKNRATE